MQLKKFILFLIFILGVPSLGWGSKGGQSSRASVQSTPKLAEDIVTVQMLFNYKNSPLKLELYEVPLELVLDVTAYGVVSNDKPLPVLRPMPPEFRAKRGETKYFAMVVKNPTAQPFYFYASYHQLRPEEASIGYVLNCLCVNKVFRVPAGHTWYRIGSFNLAHTFIGNFIAIRHDIFGLSHDEVVRRKVEKMVAK